MPDIEKVIVGLLHCKDHECDGCPYYLGTDGSFFCVGKRLYDDALELLKEQEAAEPIPFFTETGEESKNYVVCGNCKSIKAIMPKATKQKYCHECGKPILWEGR